MGIFCIVLMIIHFILRSYFSHLVIYIFNYRNLSYKLSFKMVIQYAYQENSKLLIKNCVYVMKVIHLIKLLINVHIVRETVVIALLVTLHSVQNAISKTLNKL